MDGVKEVLGIGRGSEDEDEVEQMQSALEVSIPSVSEAAYFLRRSSVLDVTVPSVWHRCGPLWSTADLIVCVSGIHIPLCGHTTKNCVPSSH